MASGKEASRRIVFPIFNLEIEELADDFLFSDNVHLRKISKEEIDLFHDQKQTHPTMWSDGAHLIYFINDRTMVFEIKDTISRSTKSAVERANDFFSEAKRLIYVTQLAMRLQKSETGFCKIFVLQEDSKILRRGVINPPFPYKPSNCKLGLNEIHEIDSLVSRISKLDLEHNNRFRVACERFSRCHEERRDDDRIIDLAIGFEALFTDENTSKLEYMGKFVGLGCSMLLGKDKEDREFIQAFLEKAFGLRNKFVHSLKVLRFPVEVKPINNEFQQKAYNLREFTIQFQTYLGDSLKKLI